MRRNSFPTLLSLCLLALVALLPAACAEKRTSVALPYEVGAPMADGCAGRVDIAPFTDAREQPYVATDGEVTLAPEGDVGMWAARGLADEMMLAGCVTRMVDAGTAAPADRPLITGTIIELLTTETSMIGATTRMRMQVEATAADGTRLFSETVGATVETTGVAIDSGEQLEEALRTCIQGFLPRLVGQLKTAR